MHSSAGIRQKRSLKIWSARGTARRRAAARMLFIMRVGTAKRFLIPCVIHGRKIEEKETENEEEEESGFVRSNKGINRVLRGSTFFFPFFFFFFSFFFFTRREFSSAARKSTRRQRFLGASKPCIQRRCFNQRHGARLISIDFFSSTRAAANETNEIGYVQFPNGLTPSPRLLLSVTRAIFDGRAIKS